MFIDEAGTYQTDRNTNMKEKEEEGKKIIKKKIKCWSNREINLDCDRNDSK